MHDEVQLNGVATGCGLALGELIQDESEKRLLLIAASRTERRSSGCASPNGRGANGAQGACS